MKKLILLIALIGLFLVGCEESNYNPVGSNNNQPALQKEGLIGGNGIINILHNVTSTLLSVTKIIDGSKGGSIQLVQNVLVNNQRVRVNANINFSKGAINGKQNITMIVDPNDASITFQPHIASFNNKVKLDLTIEGVNLSKLNLNNSKSIYFAYFNDAGIPVEQITCKKVEANEKSGALAVQGAELQHFSRYCWATKQ